MEWSPTLVAPAVLGVAAVSGRLAGSPIHAGERPACACRCCSRRSPWPPWSPIVVEESQLPHESLIPGTSTTRNTAARARDPDTASKEVRAPLSGLACERRFAPWT
jgi:hypothetical protein